MTYTINITSPSGKSLKGFPQTQELSWKKYEMWDEIIYDIQHGDNLPQLYPGDTITITIDKEKGTEK